MISHDARLHMSAAMSKKKVSKREEFKQEEVLQAVVIADSFTTRFAPLTHNIPRVKLRCSIVYPTKTFHHFIEPYFYGHA